eukprot:UN05074
MIFLSKLFSLRPLPFSRNIIETFTSMYIPLKDWDEPDNQKLWGKEFLSWLKLNIYNLRLTRPIINKILLLNSNLNNNHNTNLLSFN